MSKELEAFGRIALHTEYDNDGSYDSLYFEDDCKLVEQALQRLEAINNADPSETLKCLANIAKCIAVFKLRQEGKDECNYMEEMKNASSAYEFNTIKQALLKAQKEHKTLEIIKKNAYNSGICITYLKSNRRYSRMKNYEHYCMTIRECDRVSEDEFDLLKEVLENE